MTAIHVNPRNEDVWATSRNRMSDTGYVAEAPTSKVVVKAPHVGLQDALVAMGFKYRIDESGTNAITV